MQGHDVFSVSVFAGVLLDVVVDAIVVVHPVGKSDGFPHVPIRGLLAVAKCVVVVHITDVVPRLPG